MCWVWPVTNGRDAAMHNCALVVPLIGQTIIDRTIPNDRVAVCNQSHSLGKVFDTLCYVGHRLQTGTHFIMYHWFETNQGNSNSLDGSFNLPFNLGMTFYSKSDSTWKRIDGEALHFIFDSVINVSSYFMHQLRLEIYTALWKPNCLSGYYMPWSSAASSSIHPSSLAVLEMITSIIQCYHIPLQTFVHSIWLSWSSKPPRPIGNKD